MVADRVTFRCHPPHQFGMPLGHLSDHEERRPDVVLFEDVEQARGVLGVRPVVEGQTDGVRRRWAAHQEPSAGQQEGEGSLQHLADAADAPWDRSRLWICLLSVAGKERFDDARELPRRFLPGRGGNAAAATARSCRAVAILRPAPRIARRTS
jgi:hypothetical protein